MMNKRDIKKLYHYKARVLRVIDGDTCDVQIDLGFGLTHADKPLADPVKGTRIRLYGINTPETRTKDKVEKALGLKAKKALIDKVEHRDIVLQTVKDKSGKYGRILGVLWLNGRNINSWLVKNNYAEENYYGKS